MTISFNPNTIVSPTDCEETQPWEYFVHPCDVNEIIDYSLAAPDLYVSATKSAEITFQTPMVGGSYPGSSLGHPSASYYYYIWGVLPSGTEIGRIKL